MATDGVPFYAIERAAPMTPGILFFDVGNVLLYFDHQLACRQIAELVDSDEQRIWDLLFKSGFELRYERGEISTDEFYETFCEAVGKRPAIDALARASSDIFRVNPAMHAIASQLHVMGYRLGLLSNTSEMHWNFFSDGRYDIIPRIFDVKVLSFQVGALKPDPTIYQAAADLSGVELAEIFFIDDIAGHVEGACAAGIDAVQYTSPSSLVTDLRKRGIRINF